MLHKCDDNSVRNQFIDQCDVTNPIIVENGILKVSKDTID